MKVKTADLIGPALDWAVAKCEGFTDLRINPNRYGGTAGDKWIMTPPRVEWGPVTLADNNFSTDWAQGGPIIDLLIADGYVISKADYELGVKFFRLSGGNMNCSYGPTPLIAAMRCYVASKLGDEVDIPEELI